MLRRDPDRPTLAPAGSSGPSPHRLRRSLTALAAALLLPVVAMQGSAGPAQSQPQPLLPGTIVYGAANENGVDTVYALSPGSSTPQQLGAGDQPVLSPNGEYLAYRSGSDEALDAENIYVEDLATGTTAEVLDLGSGGFETSEYYSFDPTSQYLYADENYVPDSDCDWVVVPVTGADDEDPPSVFDGDGFYDDGNYELPDCGNESDNFVVDGQPVDPVVIPGSTADFVGAA
ncbi:MAG TPA: hypothetical protein VMD59_10985, partial [Acidimicrobiales bacterium]|nr:hypothetical protein [Acidimicrobiales bacterium]